MKIKIKLKDLSKLIENEIECKIDTPTGYKQITDVYEKYGEGKEIFFDDDTSLKAANQHKVLVNDIWKNVEEFKPEDIISNKRIKNITNVSYQKWIDFSVDVEHESYYHQGIIHHNSGKSLILFTILKFLRELERKILLIVPTVNLVEQMNQDFIEYAVNTDPLDVQMVYSGKTTDVSSPIMISTWQSLQRLDKEWFAQFDGVIVDETHLATGNTLQKILDYCVNADFRLGMTGTLSGEKIDEMLLVSAIGETKKIISTSELIEQNFLSNLKIKCLIFDHNLQYKKMTYQEEIDYLISNEYRNMSIVRLTTSLKGNTLILFNYVEKHGAVLYDMFLEKNLDKNIFFISGETKAEIRENIRQQVKSEDSDNIIVASSGVFSTGINIPSLHNVIFASPTKSRIKVLQSVGRILRQHQSKDVATVYDLSDKLFPKRFNYTYSHFEQRYQYYLEENFDLSYYELKLK